MEYFSATERKGPLTQAAAWLSLRAVMLSERSRTKEESILCHPIGVPPPPRPPENADLPLGTVSTHAGAGTGCGQAGGIRTGSGNYGVTDVFSILVGVRLLGACRCQACPFAQFKCTYCFSMMPPNAVEREGCPTCSPPVTERSLLGLLLRTHWFVPANRESDVQAGLSRSWAAVSALADLTVPPCAPVFSL